MVCANGRTGSDQRELVFVVEPLGIDRLFRSYALREKDHAFAIATRLHWAALLIAAFTIGAGVLGAHGYLP